MSRQRWIDMATGFFIGMSFIIVLGLILRSVTSGG